MKKTILLGIAIASAFMIGILSANPVVEAVGGWQAAIAGHETRITDLENQPAGVTDFYTKSVSGGFSGGNNPGTLTADCDAGDIATGGGYSITGASTVNHYFAGPFPIVPPDGSKGTPTSYRVSVQVPVENLYGIQTFVNCADVTP